MQRPRCPWPVVLALSMVVLVSPPSRGAPGDAASRPAASPQSPGHTAVQDSGKIRSPTYGYELDLPGADWSIHRPPPADANPDVDAELRSTAGGFVQVIAEESVLAPTALSKLGLENLKSVCVDFKEIESKAQRIGGMDGLIVVGAGKVDDAPMKFYLGYVSGKRNCYQVLCWTPAVLYEDNLKAFERLVASLRETAAPPAASVAASLVARGLEIENRVLGYALTLPSSDWSVSPGQGDPAGEVQLESRRGGFCAIGAGEANLTAAAASRLFIEGMRQSVADLKELRRGRRAVAGLEAEQVILSGTQDKVRTRYLLTHLCGARQCYQVMGWAIETLFDDNLGELEALVNGFRELSTAAPAPSPSGRPSGGR